MLAVAVLLSCAMASTAVFSLMQARAPPSSSINLVGRCVCSASGSIANGGKAVCQAVFPFIELVSQSLHHKSVNTLGVDILEGE